MLLALFFAGSTNGMFMPERIDHHGWQLALLALSIAAIADPKRVRGGLVLGISSALSLAIGLEMIIYLALAGAAMVLMWVADRGRARAACALMRCAGGRLRARFPRCSLLTTIARRCATRLSPVWLSDALLGGALMYGLAWLSPGDWKRRLALAVVAGVVIAGFHALMWPHCLQRLEGVSPEVDRLWLSHVKEARPVYMHGWRIALLVVALPVDRRDRLAAADLDAAQGCAAARRSSPRGLPGLAASLLLLWQTRTGPASQMMAVVGAAALAWFLVPFFWRSKQLGGACVGRSAGGRARRRRGGAVRPDFIPEKPGDRARAGDRQGQPAVRFAVGAAADRAPAQRHGVHLRRPRPAADRGDPS